MEAPYSIASIPRPIDDTNGRAYASPIFGIRDSRKRKRHEVVVGVDGESVNLYNVQSQRSIASYALPPQTYLCCPPLSLYMRGPPNSSPRRVTYCVVKDGPEEQKRRLVSFTESLGKNTADSAAPERKECKLKETEVVSLDAFTRANDGSPAVVVTYLDGVTSIINGDLSNSVDIGRPSVQDPAEYEVESAGTIDIEACRKGLLKDREDVHAMLEPMGGSAKLQWRVVRTGTARKFQLLSMSMSALDGMQSLNRGTTLLMSPDLPSPGKMKTGSCYELHAPSGLLYELVGGKLSIYNLSGTVPKLVTRVGNRSNPISSFSRLSTHSVLAVGGGIATVYETKYGSVQGSMSLITNGAASQPRKRKHEEIDGELGRFNLVTWFSELGLAVGICGSELMALDGADSLISNRRDRGHGTRLADVIGKGTQKEGRSLLKVEKKSEKWLEWTTRVDEFAAANDIEELESLVANDRKLGRQRKARDSKHIDRDAGFAYDELVYNELWPLPETFDPENLDRNKVQYLLGQTFALSDAPDVRPQIVLRSTKLIEWLALTGFLSVASIRQSPRSVNSACLSENTIRPGDIMAAVRQIDEDFQLMHDLIHLPVHWDVEEIVQALRLILQSFSTDPPSNPPLALPAPSTANEDEQLPNGDAESELDVAEDELDHAFNALTAGLEVRSDALRAIFARLHALSHPDVTSNMRSMMSQDELFFLIHILRIELADGGWTSRYVDIGEGTGAEGGMVDALAGIEESGPSDESIKVIGFLLNCAVDAIGVSGWLVGLGGNWTAKELVESLRAEVSAGYEGCLEANTIKALLAEIERYAGQIEPGVYAAAGVDEDGIEKAVLPVGGRAVAPEVMARNNRKETKSRFARLQEKSRSVGKYSFERIRI